MKILLLALALFIFPAVVLLWIMIPIIKIADHYEMLSLAMADYMTDSYNFDLSHYPDVTEQEIQNQLKWLAESKKEELQRKCNDKTVFIFDE